MGRPIVVSIGDIVADLILKVDLPIPADRLIMTEVPIIEPGGAGNFGITAARLGLACKMIGAPGRDSLGDMVVGILRDEGVDTSLIRQLADVPTTLVTVLADTVRLTQTYISALVPSQGTYEFDADVERAIMTANALYIQGYTLCEDYLWAVTRESMLQAAGRVPIYFDPSPLFVTAAPDRRAFALEHADVILATEDELNIQFGGRNPEQVYAQLLDGNARLIVVKRNVQGCRVVTREGTQDFPAFAVKAVGASAAGDAFNAGFIAARLHDLSIKDSARVANATGAAKVRKLGGGRNVPHLKEVNDLLTQNGVVLPLAGWL